MSVNTVTHLNFRGDARQALEFYSSVFGGEVAIVTYKDANNVQELTEANQVMWGQVVTNNGFQVMAFDVPSQMPWDQGNNAFYVSVRGETSEEISTYWEKLTENATIIQPLESSQWAPLYGMLKDRFGIIWVVDVISPYNG